MVIDGEITNASTELEKLLARVVAFGVRWCRSSCPLYDLDEGFAPVKRLNNAGPHEGEFHKKFDSAHVAVSDPDDGRAAGGECPTLTSRARICRWARIRHTPDRSRHQRAARWWPVPKSAVYTIA